jgi:plastocyanin
VHKKLKIFVIAGVLASLFITSTAAPAKAVVAVAGPGGFAAGFATPVVLAPTAIGVTFVNGDIQPHNVIATADFFPKKEAKKVEWCKSYAKTKCPVFWSDTVAVGESTPVLGIDNLVSGQQYAFFCSIHPGMKGTLVAI